MGPAAPSSRFEKNNADIEISQFRLLDVSQQKCEFFLLRCQPFIRSAFFRYHPWSPMLLPINEWMHDSEHQYMSTLGLG